MIRRLPTLVAMGLLIGLSAPAVQAVDWQYMSAQQLAGWASQAELPWKDLGDTPNQSMLRHLLIAGQAGPWRSPTPSEAAFYRLHSKIVAAGVVDRSPSDCGDKGDFARARRVLIWLHEDGTLDQFDVLASGLQRTLLEGRFNCLSSSLLLQLLCREFGIETRLAQLGDHVAVAVNCGDRWQVLESTHTRGVTSVGEPSLPSAFPQSLRLLNDQQTLALVFYNQGAHALAAKRDIDALSFSQAAIELDPENKAAEINRNVALLRVFVPLVEQINRETTSVN
ncbi:MAG: hypothetical protein KDA42_03660 [Planctomycetales bacterium]|nr:hypothetical protein [Planctomycetales bacterium]